MLKHSGARVLLASDDEQLAKVLPSLPLLPDLQEVVVFSRTAAERHGLLSLDADGRPGRRSVDEASRAARAAAVRCRRPGHRHVHLGHHRPAQGHRVHPAQHRLQAAVPRLRAAATIGEGDVFLCYLPLYHTFGRWLELIATLWWGATYVFARSTVAGLAARGLPPGAAHRLHPRPQEVDGAARGGGLGGGLRRPRRGGLAACGPSPAGRLRHGLSAAGYLDPVVFHAFHGAGIELCSGLRHDRGHRRRHHDAARRVPRRLGREAAARDRVPARRGRRAAHPRPLRLARLLPSGGRRAGRRTPTAGSTPATSSSRRPRGTGASPGARRRSTRTARARRSPRSGSRTCSATSSRWRRPSWSAITGSTTRSWCGPPPGPRTGARRRRLTELLSSLVASANRFLAPFERVVAFQVLPRALDEEHGELTSFARGALEEVLPCLETAEAAPVPGPLLDGTTSVASGAATLRASYWLRMGVFRQDRFARSQCAGSWNRGHGERFRPTAWGPRLTGSVRQRRLASSSRRRSRKGASLFPLVALFAVGVLALLDCERQDWNAVARGLQAARQMIEAGALGEYWMTAGVDLASGLASEQGERSRGSRDVDGSEPRALSPRPSSGRDRQRAAASRARP